jgi:oxalate decarboxylase/phosphoglucose isomerase-like protein (cupin superfamily)
MFETYMLAYLESLGRDSVWLQAHWRPNTMFCWATVASQGNFHMLHTHPENQISGVYYSRIPGGAAPIIFEDPRGPRWPFDGRYIHKPSPGDLVLFPSWLAHQVTPTQGKEMRVSWSCNQPGSWEDLADVNLV